MLDNSPGKFIGLMTDQHPRLLVGMLGILASGNAFVPIDPDYPDERIRFILADCQIQILITEAKYVEKIRGLAQDHSSLQHVICLDRLQDGPVADPVATTEEDPVTIHDCTEYATEERVDAPAPVDLDQTAYVIYTSGSTGTPKGVPITHRNLCPLLHWSRAYFRFGEHTSVLQNLNYCFDFGVFELVTTLFFGGTLHFLGEDRLGSVAQYAAYIDEHGINTIHSTPSFFRNIIAFSGRLENLEVLHLGGEALTEQSVDDIFEKVGDSCIVYNGYGPTEATVNCSIYKIGTREEWERKRRANVPIGAPSANNTIYILNENHAPVPAYVPGELAVGGAGLTPGYLNRPDLTGERFIPNPFADEPGSRLYKTGDRARYLPDGNIEFLGRIDNQVKVRGFRIELGEIEAALEEHPAIQAAVVLTWDEENGDKRLVAYTVSIPGETPPTSALRAFLQRTLPEYMVPSAFVQLDAFPLNPNGKIDRKALPKPDLGRPFLENRFVAPRTPQEEVLAEIWRQVLGMETVGIYDNFFDLGGDSMRIIQITARANQKGLSLTPAQIFQNPTIADLVQQAGATATTPSQQEIVTGPVPLTPIQHWFFQQDLPDPHHWNWSFLRQVSQKLEPDLLAEALRHLLRHHDALRLRFYRTDAGYQQVNADLDEDLPLTVVDLSAVAPEQQRDHLEAAAAHLQTSLDLSEGPLMRVAYFALGSSQADRVLIIFHHLVVDVISTQVLLEDLQTILEQLQRGQPVQLPPKTTAFQTWSRRLWEYAQSDELRQELAQWLDALRVDATPLPLDTPGGRNTEASADLIVAALDAESTRSLLQEMPALGVQTQEVLLTALVRTVGRWTGKPTLLVEMEGHGREHILPGVDLSRTVGWFTSVYPVHFDLRHAPQPEEALRAVQRQLQQIPNKGIGFGILRYLCKDSDVKAQMQALPQAEVNFNYLGQLEAGSSQEGIFHWTPENRGAERSPRGTRAVPLYIVGSVRGGILRMHWNYSTNLPKQSTVNWLAETYLEELRSLLNASLATQEFRTKFTLAR